MTQTENQTAAVRDRLRAYLSHKAECGSIRRVGPAGAYFDHVKTCTCGLDAALAAQSVTDSGAGVRDRLRALLVEVEAVARALGEESGDVGQEAMRRDIGAWLDEQAGRVWRLHETLSALAAVPPLPLSDTTDNPPDADA